jgi:outer membrane protein assembly factor BamA
MSRRVMHPPTGLRLVAVLALGLVSVPVVALPVRAARLEYRGRVLSSRQAQAACGAALSAPGDSAALRAGLGAVVTRLQESGFLDARAEGRWDDAATLRLDVTEGTRYLLREVVARAASPKDSVWIAGSLGLVPGTPASPGAWSAALDRGVLAAAANGHPYATLVIVGWDPDSAGGLRVTVAGSLGAPVTLSGLRIDGLRVTRPSFVARAVGPVAGTPYRPALGDQVRERLEGLELFRHVGAPSLEGDGDPSRATLVIPVEEPGYNAFEGALGVQSQGHVVGQARVQLDNLGGTGRALGVDWESRGPGVVQFAARAAEPQVMGWPLRLEGHVEQQLQDSLYTRTRWGARARLGLGGSERMELGVDQDRVVQEQGPVAQASTQVTLFALEHSGLDSRLSPRRGVWARLEGSQSFTREQRRPDGRATSRASAAEATATWHRPTSARSGLALSLEAAGRWSTDRILPLYDRYPLGGATRLRGYDEDQFRVDRYALARAEWRRFLDDASTFAFLFWDHAMAQTRVEDGAGGRLEMLDRDGYGAGVQLATGVGRVGLTYGVAAGRPPFEGRIHLRLVTAF